MADLISRAAALEVIEAVKNVCWSQSGKVLCGKMFSQIKDLPAVDVVPVEWLKKLCDSYDYNLFYSIPLKQVLKSWEIEKQLQNERRDSE